MGAAANAAGYLYSHNNLPSQRVPGDRASPGDRTVSVSYRTKRRREISAEQLGDAREPQRLAFGAQPRRFLA